MKSAPSPHSAAPPAVQPSPSARSISTTAIAVKARTGSMSSASVTERSSRAMANELTLVISAPRHAVARTPDRHAILMFGLRAEQGIGSNTDQAILPAQILPIVGEGRLEPEEAVTAPARYPRVDERTIGRRQRIVVAALAQLRKVPPYRFPNLVGVSRQDVLGPIALHLVAQGQAQPHEFLEPPHVDAVVRRFGESRVPPGAERRDHLGAPAPHQRIVPDLASDDVVLRQRGAKLLPDLLELLALVEFDLEAVDDDVGLEGGDAAVDYPIGRALELVGQKGGPPVTGFLIGVEIGNRVYRPVGEGVLTVEKPVFADQPQAVRQGKRSGSSHVMRIQNRAGV